MKPANLMLSAAVASLMLFSPAAFTTADAAGIKIKPQIIKVRPRIRIKPKVKIKVRTAKIRIKPKVKVKVRAAQVRMKPKLQLPAVQLHKKPRVTPKVAVPQKAKAAVTLAALNSHSRGNRKLLPETPNYGSHPLPSNPGSGPKVSVSTSTPGTGVNTGVSHPTKAPNTPTLNVPRGFVDVFGVAGGNMNDAMRNAADLAALMGERAIPDLINSGFGDGQGSLPTGDGLGRQRFAPGMEQAPIGAADAPNDGGFASSGSGKNAWRVGATWRSNRTGGGGGDNNTSTQLTRVNSQGERQTYTEHRNDNGSITTVQTTDRGNEGTTTVTIEGANADSAQEGDQQELTVTTVGPDGKEKVETVVVSTPTVPTEMDQNGDGVPDGTIIPPATAGGGDQGGNYIPPSTYSSTWNPMNGEVISTVTPFDRISQPDHNDGTTGERSARPNVGAAAVTNTGDGGFVAGGNTGGNGGFGHDPCATIKGAGCGGSGPDSPGPEGTVADAGTASSH